jgi:hypothetical protein
LARLDIYRLIAIYDLGDRLDQRIVAMTRWCAALEDACAKRGIEKPEKGADVIALLNPRRISPTAKSHRKPSSLLAQ